MPLYNFKPQFAALIRSGAKRQTIRARGKRLPPQPGEVAHCYTGLRTRNVCVLGKFPIKDVTPISISVPGRVVSMPGLSRWRELDEVEIEQLARDDGFDSADAFFKFFAAEHWSTFSGFLIKWYFNKEAE